MGFAPGGASLLDFVSRYLRPQGPAGPQQPIATMVDPGFSFMPKGIGGIGGAGGTPSFGPVPPPLELLPGGTENLELSPGRGGPPPASLPSTGGFGVPTQQEIAADRAANGGQMSEAMRQRMIQANVAGGMLTGMLTGMNPGLPGSIGEMQARGMGGGGGIVDEILAAMQGMPNTGIPSLPGVNPQGSMTAQGGGGEEFVDPNRSTTQGAQPWHCKAGFTWNGVACVPDGSEEVDNPDLTKQRLASQGIEQATAPNGNPILRRADSPQGQNPLELHPGRDRPGMPAPGQGGAGGGGGVGVGGQGGSVNFFGGSSGIPSSFFDMTMSQLLDRFRPQSNPFSQQLDPGNQRFQRGRGDPSSMFFNPGLPPRTNEAFNTAAPFFGQQLFSGASGQSFDPFPNVRNAMFGGLMNQFGQSQGMFNPMMQSQLGFQGGFGADPRVAGQLLPNVMQDALRRVNQPLPGFSSFTGSVPGAFNPPPPSAPPGGGNVPPFSGGGGGTGSGTGGTGFDGQEPEIAEGRQRFLSLQNPNQGFDPRFRFQQPQIAGQGALMRDRPQRPGDTPPGGGGPPVSGGGFQSLPTPFQGLNNPMTQGVQNMGNFLAGRGLPQQPLIQDAFLPQMLRGGMFGAQNFANQFQNLQAGGGNFPQIDRTLTHMLSNVPGQQNTLAQIPGLIDRGGTLSGAPSQFGQQGRSGVMDASSRLLQGGPLSPFDASGFQGPQRPQRPFSMPSRAPMQGALLNRPIEMSPDRDGVFSMAPQSGGGLQAGNFRPPMMNRPGGAFTTGSAPTSGGGFQAEAQLAPFGTPGQGISMQRIGEPGIAPGPPPQSSAMNAGGFRPPGMGAPGQAIPMQIAGTPGISAQPPRALGMPAQRAVEPGIGPQGAGGFQSGGFQPPLMQRAGTPGIAPPNTPGQLIPMQRIAEPGLAPPQAQGSQGFSSIRTPAAPQRGGELAGVGRQSLGLSPDVEQIQRPDFFNSLVNLATGQATGGGAPQAAAPGVRTPSAVGSPGIQSPVEASLRGTIANAGINPEVAAAQRRLFLDPLQERTQRGFIGQTGGAASAGSPAAQQLLAENERDFLDRQLNASLGQLNTAINQGMNLGGQQFNQGLTNERMLQDAANLGTNVDLQTVLANLGQMGSAQGRGLSALTGLSQQDISRQLGQGGLDLDAFRGMLGARGQGIDALRSALSNASATDQFNISNLMRGGEFNTDALLRQMGLGASMQQQGFGQGQDLGRFGLESLRTGRGLSSSSVGDVQSILDQMMRSSQGGFGQGMDLARLALQGATGLGGQGLGAFNDLARNVVGPGGLMPILQGLGERPTILGNQLAGQNRELEIRALQPMLQQQQMLMNMMNQGQGRGIDFLRGEQARNLQGLDLGGSLVRAGLGDLSRRSEGFDIAGLLGGAGAAAGGLASLLPLLGISDVRLKRDVRRIGLIGGVNVYKFRYLWSDVEEFGVMAQELEQDHPDLVYEVEGYKVVDYGGLRRRLDGTA